jgi:hypothetical protein
MLIALSAAALVAFAVPAFAQSGFSALGLSASPDEYVGEITVPYGEDFSLYVFMTGPELSPLPFELDTIDWALLASCCGGSPAFYFGNVMNEEMDHEGDPAVAVFSKARQCVSGDFIVLAQVTFNWIYEPTGSFHLGAASLSAAMDCEGEPWILTGLPLRVVPTGITPAEETSWGDLKNLFR